MANQIVRPAASCPGLRGSGMRGVSGRTLSPTPSSSGHDGSAVSSATAAHRPAVLPAPGFAARVALGEFAGEILLSERIVGEVLVASGYQHVHPDLEAAARWVVG